MRDVLRAAEKKFKRKQEEVPEFWHVICVKYTYNCYKKIIKERNYKLC